MSYIYLPTGIHRLTNGTGGHRPEDNLLLRAFYKEDGAILAEVELPATPWSTPMSYISNDRQYLVVAIGEGADSKLIGLALSH